MVMDGVSEENLMTYMDVVVQTLLRLKDKRWVNPTLVTPDLTVYLTLKAQEAIDAIDDADAEDEFVDAPPMPGFAQMVVDEAMARGINPLTDKEAFLAFANSPEQIESGVRCLILNIRKTCLVLKKCWVTRCLIGKCQLKN